MSIAPSLLSEWHVLFDILLAFSPAPQARKVDTHTYTHATYTHTHSHLGLKSKREGQTVI